jgi:hypothetical protein
MLRTTDYLRFGLSAASLWGYLHRLFVEDGGDVIVTFQLIEPAHVI